MLHAFLKSAIYQIFNPIYCVCAMGKQASFVLCLFFFFLYYFVDDGLFVRVQVQEKVLCGQLLYLCKYDKIFTEFKGEEGNGHWLMVGFFSYLVDGGLFMRVQVQEKAMCGQWLYLCKYITVFTEFKREGGMVAECSDCLCNNSVMFIYIYMPIKLTFCRSTWE